MAGADGTGARGGRWLAVLVRRWRAVLLCAAAVAAVAGGIGHAVSDHLSTAGMLSASAESTRADQALERHFRLGAPQLVFVARAHSAVDERGPTAAGRALARRLSADPAVEPVRCYWSAGAAGAAGAAGSAGSAEGEALRSRDGRAALVLVRLRGDDTEMLRAARRLMDRETGKRGGLRVSASGEAAGRVEIARQVERDRARAELLALPVTAVLLLFVFRSVTAALLPVAVGAFAVLGMMATLRVLTSFTEVSLYAVSVNSALGFALAVDYSLFLVGRYREEQAKGVDAARALELAWAAAGRVVVFSAATVALSLCALLLFPNLVLRSIAWGGIAVVVLAATVSLLVVPALIAGLGPRLERGEVFARWRRAPARVPGENRSRTGPWGRLALWVSRRPLRVALAVTGGLILLAAPFTQVRFGLLDERQLPPSSTVVRTQHEMRKRFPTEALATATPVVLTGFTPSSQRSELDRYARRISGDPAVATVETATGRYAGGTRTARTVPSPARFTATHAAWLAVTPRGDPRDLAQADLVRRLRAAPAPAPVRVGGPGARLTDVRQPLVDRLLWTLCLIGGTGLLVVLLLTRRPVLALKALVLNVLSLSATFGALVFVFQQGHGTWLLGGYSATGTTDVTAPVMILCIAFGLSMDYEILLLSRILEEHRKTADTATAVAQGLDRSARLFTWAALTLAAVMATGATGGLDTMKVVCVGVALAVLLDATVVRGLLVPAVMQLAGDANWWSPRFLSHHRSRGTFGAVPAPRAAAPDKASTGRSTRCLELPDIVDRADDD